MKFPDLNEEIVDSAVMIYFTILDSYKFVMNGAIMEWKTCHEGSSQLCMVSQYIHIGEMIH